MTLPGEKQFLNTDYERHVFNSAESALSKWLQEEITTSEELEENLKKDTEGVVGRILGAENPSETETTLFFEYMPDTFNHPVQVLGKPIKNIPEFKILKEYADSSRTGMTLKRPPVLLHNLGIYMTCVTVQTQNISAERLEQNMTILRGKAQENWDRILNPGNYSKKKKK